MQKRSARGIRLFPHRAGAVDLNGGVAFLEDAQLGDRDPAGLDAVVGKALVDDLIKQGLEQRRVLPLGESLEKVPDMIVVDVAEGREATMFELCEQADIDRKLVGPLRVLLPWMDAAARLHDYALQPYDQVVGLREGHGQRVKRPRPRRIQARAEALWDALPVVIAKPW